MADSLEIDTLIQSGEESFENVIVEDLCGDDDSNGNSNSNASVSTTASKCKLGTVAKIIGSWDGQDFDRWFRRFDQVAKAYRFVGSNRHDLLIATIGFERAGDILVMAADTAIDATNDSWLEECFIDFSTVA